jgi:hypothetical protein
MSRHIIYAVGTPGVATRPNDIPMGQGALATSQRPLGVSISCGLKSSNMPDSVGYVAGSEFVTA